MTNNERPRELELPLLALGALCVSALISTIVLMIV